ncbi:MAG: zinc-ribbon domain-containing protein, partial [Candidatus Bathyarchaeota archaeon]|nr:zinc-ribbon domain-containing protein [Candidatus Bathyarchaeota archaeon]
MLCTQCGKEISSESNYCPFCGARSASMVVERGSIKYEIKYSPSYALLEVQLPENGHVIAEAGAL